MDEPLTCWMPSFSTSPGGKIRDAKARRKMAENSVSSPPIPMSSNLKFGARIALGGGLAKETSQMRVTVVEGCGLSHTFSHLT